jgi:hypothetical protein
LFVTKAFVIGKLFILLELRFAFLCGIKHPYVFHNLVIVLEIIVTSFLGGLLAGVDRFFGFFVDLLLDDVALFIEVVGSV